jgi:hypothetical protein
MFVPLLEYFFLVGTASSAVIVFLLAPTGMMHESCVVACSMTMAKSSKSTLNFGKKTIIALFFDRETF